MANGAAEGGFHREPVNNPEDELRYRFRPEQFPRRLELELSPQALHALKDLSDKTGRSMGEIAEELISRGLNSPARRQH